MISHLDEYVKQKHYRLLNSVLIYKNNNIILERYYNKNTADSRHNIKSIWKSILSVCCGIAIDKGMIKSVEEPIAAYLPMFDGRNNPNHPLITVKHLLTMTSGIYWNGGVKYHCPMMTQFNRVRNHIEFISEVKMAAVPGTMFLYKEWDVILLSAVLSAASGMNTFDLCNEYLYKPLDIKSRRWFTFSDELCYNIGTSSAEQAESDLSARDLIKIGLLFRNNGKWNDSQIVSKEYVKETLTAHQPGYGYLWWLFHDGYGCSGYGGQQIRVIPEHNIVYVLQASVLNSHKDYNDVIHEILNLLV